MGTARLLWKIAVVVVALMSGILSLVREVLQFVNPAKYFERPLFFLCLTIAFIASSLILLSDEYRKRKAAENRWEDQRPRLGLNLIVMDGRNTWREHNNPFIAQLRLLSGRVPESIHFDPISSKSGRFVLKFQKVPFLTPPVPKSLAFEVEEVGNPDLRPRDRELTHEYHRDRLLDFLSDAPDRAGRVEYPLVVRFSDRGDRRQQTFHLRWDWIRHGFGEDTT